MLKKTWIIFIIFIALVGCNDLSSEACGAARDFLKQKALAPDSVNIISFEELESRDGVAAAWMEFDQRNAFNANIRQRGLAYVDVAHKTILHSDECKMLDIRAGQAKALYNSNDKFREYVGLGFKMAEIERNYMLLTKPNSQR